jgi:alkanesulfonate monooxygenase SsuD/methylene tetrahydromethanopterin reductase-like flavin-dependent oxidoreductase (luciferase family)
MRVSIGVTNFSWPSGPGGLSGELVRLVRDADQAGVDTVWVADHLLQADPDRRARGHRDARGVHHPRVPRRAD